VKADALNPRELFGTTVHYEIPAFQRPYVWSEEDQWAPLWQDVRRVAERIIQAGEDADALAAISGHFLGAVVLKSKPPTAGDVTRHSVIDGQQRTTTLQLLLDAVQEILADREHPLEAEALEELILNGANRFAGKAERFKLWPSRSDRDAFEAAMAGNHGALDEHLIVQAHTFFRKEVADWLDGIVEGDGQPVGTEDARAHALADVMQSRLLLVAINLAGHDDDQVIFETLNDRGTPLLKADLIKNWIFQTGEQVGADVEAWPDKYWLDLDDSWWREEISQGRHLRSRIDIFLQYWLTMRTRAEVLTDDVFRAFIEHAKPRMTMPSEAEALLVELRRDADTFRSFAQLSPTTVEGRFYSRVVEALELASTTPLLLWLLSENHAVPPVQVERALGALESWVIRRTLLRYTMKGVNLLMVSILTDLDAAEVDKAGDRVVAYLAAQTADARTWPTDDEVRASLPGVRLYGNVRQPRIRVVLEALEEQLRTEKHEALAIPPGMQIEHVMPQGWRNYWDESPPLSPEAAANRDRLVNTIGNLTLLTQKLNGALSNRPWTDVDAAQVGTTGHDAGLGKRALINKYSLLVLSRELVEDNPLAWTEDAIRARSARLSDLLCKVWRGPQQAQVIAAGA